MATDNMEPVVAWILWSVSALAVLASGYMLYIFLQHRNEAYIKIRVPALTYIYVVSGGMMILGRMFLEPHNCPFTYCKLKDDDSYEQSDITHYFNAEAYAVRLTMLTISFCLKLWYLYYAFKLQTLLINGKWWTQINEDLNQNWWIKNANKYGKPGKNTWIVLTFVIIISILFLCIIGFKVNPEIPKFVAYVQSMILAMCIIIFYCTIPNINDIYGMKKEIKWCAICFFFGTFYFPITEFASGISI